MTSRRVQKFNDQISHSIVVSAVGKILQTSLDLSPSEIKTRLQNLASWYPRSARFCRRVLISDGDSKIQLLARKCFLSASSPSDHILPVARQSFTFVPSAISSVWMHCLCTAANIVSRRTRSTNSL